MVENKFDIDSEMHVTDASDLKKVADGNVVKFPDFAEGQPFVARVRRPSMLLLAKSGKIPNTLLGVANDIFDKGGTSNADIEVNENTLSQMYDVMRIICDSALISPTMQEIEDAGVELGDDQLMAIFSYTQTGVESLRRFCPQQ